MTFGIGSPGFDPFYCPPCNTPPGSFCSTMCVDLIDAPILLVGILGLFLLLGWLNGAAPRQL